MTTSISNEAREAALSISEALWQADHAEDGEMTHAAAAVLAAKVRHLNDIVDGIIRVCLKEQECATEALQKENEQLRKCCDYTKEGKPVVKGSTLYLCPGDDPTKEVMTLKTPDTCHYCWYASPESAIAHAMNKEEK